jgi:Flp pilus assembly protein TadG
LTFRAFWSKTFCDFDRYYLLRIGADGARYSGHAIEKAGFPPSSKALSDRPSFREFLRYETGGMAAFAALLAPVLAGFIGMGLDMSIWYAMKRDVQGIADARCRIFSRRHIHRRRYAGAFETSAHSQKRKMPSLFMSLSTGLADFTRSAPAQEAGTAGHRRSDTPMQQPKLRIVSAYAGLRAR